MDAFLHAIAGDWRTAELGAADRSLCEFAAKLTHRQQSMRASDLDDLRQIGFSEEAIFDAVQVIAYFNYITRVADATGLEPEEFIGKGWGI